MNRIVKALLFDVTAFEEFERDSEIVAFGGILVFLSGILAGIGTVFAPLTTPHVLHSFVIILLIVTISFLTWFAWAGLSYLIGTIVLRGEAQFRDLVRNLGFAYIPALLSFLLVLPSGLIFITIMLLWMAGMGVVATRGAEKFGMIKAMVTTVLCWSVGIVVMANLLPSLRIVP